MNGQTDQDLLRAYSERRSEAAFAELVQRHIDFAYSAALRMVRDAHLAEDVTQCVFVALARNASQLADHPILVGWLHRTTQHLAANAVRSDVRRRAREQEAATMNELVSAEPSALWDHIAPHLDAALGELSETDRDAVLLRYFQGKSARAIAETLGTSEEAAQKRVNRAVERLRECFSKRSVTVGASSLAAVLTANAVQAAPSGLAAAISTTAALGATAFAGAAATTKAIAMTTLQKIALSATIAAAVGTPILLQHQANQSLQDNLTAQTIQVSELKAENERLSNLLAQAAGDTRSDDQSTELVRLRGQVSQLRAEQTESAKLREENNRLRAAQIQRPVSPAGTLTAENTFPRETWAFAGYANPEATLLSTAWAALSGQLETFLNSQTPDEQSRNQQNWQGKNESEIRDGLIKEFGRTKAIRILNKEPLSENEIVLTLLIEQDDGRSETPRMKVQRIGNDWKMAGPYRLPERQSP
jgi:RNA polymerase sigma factor (sigma-70 family)